MTLFAERSSPKIALNGFAKEIVLYHSAVIKILNEKNLNKLFRNSILQSTELCKASAGMFCSYRNENILNVEYATPGKYKSGNQFVIGNEILLLLKKRVKKNLLVPVELLNIMQNDSVFLDAHSSVIVSAIYVRKRLSGLVLLFDDKHSHEFTKGDLSLMSIFSETISFAAENLISMHISKQMAQTDSLTGLYNHRAFLNRADYEVKRSLRFHRPLTIAMFDVDNFKQINDRYGHLAGDKILMTLSEMCRKLFRTIDFCARYGGDEYSVLLTETSIDVAREVVVRLRDAVLNKPVHYQKQKICFSISIGIATLDTECTTVEKLIDRADTAMYFAKHISNDKIALWNKRLGPEAIQDISV
jgi:diguanylate cyclase (GGDEF)-like protein